MKRYPKAICTTGTGVREEFFFLSEKNGKEKKYTLMKAKKDCVEEVNDLHEVIGLELPIYIKLMETFIGIQKNK